MKQITNIQKRSQALFTPSCNKLERSALENIYIFV